MDVVQDAACKFLEKYSARPAEERKPLFYTILHNRIRDYHRRRKVRQYLRWLGMDDGDEDGLDVLEDEKSPNPEYEMRVGRASDALHKALSELPLRQQQAFLLRSHEELSVADTATVMGCSEGSVKTHCSRAVAALRGKLGDHWP